ncbi:sugar phosphate isomerase/epimerase family protein [Synoicihabitans lomoniglobus]|uniref:Sugar phosphate isomerase/epimerase n=1 Tax=Synoicihabitans lomoniglobus TaxID=2909285 RepID=A0AAE9ZVE8_9BACT|nr:sugar phosphate isomerase/epimerase [Opitutaceae bacterium LMO-M01]WED64797.1 sugar phosphate isomerase/epimerase [Opitutaceae bacterium LMO-M01]
MTFRSRLLLAIAALAVASTAPAHPHEDSAPLSEQIGLQLYSVRGSFLQDPFAAMDMVAGYGITEVETAGTARMTPGQFRAELEKRGLKAVSSHVQYNALKEDFAAVLNEVKTLGVGYAILPWIPHEGDFDAEDVATSIALFNKWGDAFHAAGIKFGYHPHGYEFGAGKLAGDTPFDELVAGTAGHHVYFEMDVFWVVHGGADPVTLLNKYPNRWMGLHVKDIRKGAATGFANGGAPKEDKVIVGTGQVDWPELIAVAKSHGVQHFFIEDESPDPLANIPQSIAYLNGLDL